jgi:hypothetical protein
MIARRSSVVSSPAKGLDCRNRTGPLARGAEQRDDVRQRGRVEYPAPFTESGRRVLLEPALQVPPRHVEELRVRLELGHDRGVSGQAALLYPLVAAHATARFHPSRPEGDR